MNKNNQMPGLPEQNSTVSPQQEPDRFALSVRSLMRVEVFVSVGVALLALLTFSFLLSVKKRAENVSRELDPSLVKGLIFSEQEFNPKAATTYVQFKEGGDRSVAAVGVGSTLPIVSRYNFQAMTDKNFEVIGAAPWALTNNFASNLNDPDLMLRVLSNDKVIQAFLTRPDVEPLLEDPQLLVSFAADTASMKEFFEDDTIKALLADEKMVRMIGSSKFMSHLLTSPAVKYYRDRPQEAAAVIRGNAYLSRVQQNPYVQTAVKENPYLKSIASILLKGSTSSSTAPKAPTKPVSNKTARSRRSRK